MLMNELTHADAAARLLGLGYQFQAHEPMIHQEDGITEYQNEKQRMCHFQLIADTCPY
jgi:hypothetical protein